MYKKSYKKIIVIFCVFLIIFSLPVKHFAAADSSAAVIAKDNSNFTIKKTVYAEFWTPVIDRRVFALTEAGVIGEIAYDEYDDGSDGINFLDIFDILDVVDFDAAVWTHEEYMNAAGMRWLIPDCEITAEKSDGTVWNKINDSEFMQIEGLNNIINITAGNEQWNAVDKNGDIWSWGDNKYGQPGAGFSSAVNFPINITSIAGANKISTKSGYIEIEASDGFFLRLDRHGYAE